MTPPAVAGLLALVAASVAAARLIRRHPDTLLRENHAGRQVPALLGIATGGAILGATVVAAFIDLGSLVPAMFLVGLVLAVALAGAIDDVFASGPRGLGAHLRSALRGHPTTGIVKLAVVVLSAGAYALVAGGGPLRIAATTILISVTTNVWNALDVRPGRTLKASIAVLALVLIWGWEGSVGILLAAGLGAALGGLPFDLGERAMLGDAGSNPFGFIVGVGLAWVSPTPVVIGAALLMLALQVAAETVTLSALIERVGPLRWADRLGRRPA